MSSNLAFWRTRRSGRNSLFLTILVVSVLIVASIVYMVVRRQSSLPSIDSPGYAETLKVFNVGVAAILEDQYDYAAMQLVSAIDLFPEEPASWANLGLIQIRTGKFEEAEESLLMASSLAPESSQIWLLRGILESRQGRDQVAISHFEQALSIDPDHDEARYALAREIEDLGEDDSDLLAESELDELLKRRGENLAVLIEKGRLVAKRSDMDELNSVLSRIKPYAVVWPSQVHERFESLVSASRNPEMDSMETEFIFLKNVLARVPNFRQSLKKVTASPDVVSEPFEQFLVLPWVDSVSASADMALSYEISPLKDVMPGTWSSMSATVLNADGDVGIFVADGTEVRRLGGTEAGLPFPGGDLKIKSTAAGMLPLDWNYDFRTDLVLAGAGGLRLLQQEEDGGLKDVTGEVGLPQNLIEADYAGAWTIDVELDGDLDVVLGARAGKTRVIRNNGDGTFIPIETLSTFNDLRGLVWVELDRDGDPDLALLDADGHIHLQSNERSGNYTVWSDQNIESDFVSVSASDVDGDGVMEVVGLRGDGTIISIFRSLDKSEWIITELLRWSEVPANLVPGEVRLFIRDLDNNGENDLVVSSDSVTKVWLRDAQHGFVPLSVEIDSGVYAVMDFTGDGLVDLLGLSSIGKPVHQIGNGVENYHWQIIRPLATRGDGDQRINSFALGGEVQLRAGLLAQSQRVSMLPVHFGLGSYMSVDVVRIVWPNGVFQAEFDLATNAVIDTKQRLKGSCPWLYTFDGNGMKFVTDFLWRSPLGLRINAQDTAGVTQTEDWVKIEGDELVSRDGFYELNITGELWETFFFDHVGLLVVDHPLDTEIFVDERFHAQQKAPLVVRQTTRPQPVVRAWDDHGTDVTALIRDRDGQHLGTFGRGDYQGVTRDHFVEIELGDDVSESGQLWLLGHGWVYPTDSSINVAIAQGDRQPPKGISVEVLNDEGEWVVIHPDLGFPAGKNKTVLVDLAGVFAAKSQRRLRLRTNLEVYWDSIEYAFGLEDRDLRTERLPIVTAELRHRGFSHTSVADAFSPELPHYEKIVGTGQRWLDLIGYYTRFGEVNELLNQVDDRYVIMNAGEELALQFPSLELPPEGWKRDYVLIGDGWIKDGDFNTSFSKTVLPLPSHDDPLYSTPPGHLENDPVYRRYPEDWKNYHTRYVSPDRFLNPLMTSRKSVETAER